MSVRKITAVWTFFVCMVSVFSFSYSRTPRKLGPVGLQLYSVRTALQADFEGTLAKVAAAGYDQVEFAGYYGKDPAKIKALLDSLKITAPAAHVGYDLLTGENLKKTLEAATIIEHQDLIMPSLPPVTSAGLSPTTEDCKKIAVILNQIGKACHDAGLGFSYHNHRNEFIQVDGSSTMYDILVRETDPALVDFELDIGWAVAAGVDPLGLFAQYPGRFKYFHVKDMDESNQSVVIGAGKIDFTKIFAAGDKAGVKYYIVEYEGKEDPITSVGACVKNLKEMMF